MINAWNLTCYSASRDVVAVDPSTSLGGLLYVVHTIGMGKLPHRSIITTTCWRGWSKIIMKWEKNMKVNELERVYVNII